MNSQQKLIIAYSEVYLLQHQVAQSKILSELKIPFKINKKNLSDTQEQKKQQNISTLNSQKISLFPETFELATEQEEKNPQQIYALNSKQKFAPFSYALNKDASKQKVIPPIYLSWKAIQEKFNNSEELEIPLIQQALARNQNGDLIITDQEILESQKGIFSEVLKKSAIMILKGQGLVRMSLPIRIMAPKSFIQQIPEIFANTKMLHKAQHHERSLEKFKFIICYVINCLYYGVNIQKPFNPYIGETFQGSYPDGTQIYAEHIRHDPATDAFYLINETQNFKIHGQVSLDSKMGRNHMEIILGGMITIEMGSDIFYCKLARIMNKGIVIGQRKIALSDKFLFFYPRKRIKGFVQVGKNEKAYDEIQGGIFKNKMPYDKKNKSKIFQSIFEKSYLKKTKEQKISEISGQWTNQILFDQKEYWNKNQKAYKYHIDKNVLPSDFRFREDLLWFLYNDKKQAQEWKLFLELLYRQDRNQREKISKSRKKK